MSRFMTRLRAEGVARWRAWLMWLGVRVGGGSHYLEKGNTPRVGILRFLCKL